MTDLVAATPFLSATEVDDLCAPLKQRHAQQYTEVSRRPDGLPLVGRRMVEERLNGKGEYVAPSGFNWSM